MEDCMLMTLLTILSRSWYKPFKNLKSITCKYLLNLQIKQNYSTAKMMIGEISFCDFVGYNIKSDDTKRYILECIQRKYGLKIITKHFEKYDERMIGNLQTRPHLVCIRTNGNPYFLCLTKLNFVNYCIFIDKKIQQGYCFPRMIIAHFKFDESLFDDTIIDGEMVKTNDGSWSFLINDLIVHKGEHLLEHNVVRRLNILYDTLQRDFTPDENDICRMLVKKYFKYDETNILMGEHIHTVPYSCRGIYFKPLFLKFRDILLNFDDNLIKKVERTKYKHVKSFLLNEDKKDIIDDNDAESVSSVGSAGSSKSSRSSKSSISVKSAIQNHVATVPTGNSESRVFLARKTNLPDVYELLDYNMVFVGHACVPSLSVSKYMRMLFQNKNIIDTQEVHCEYASKFNKWKPIVA